MNMKKTFFSVAKFLGWIILFEGFIFSYAISDLCYLVYLFSVLFVLAITHKEDVGELAEILQITATYRLLRMVIRKKIVYLGKRVRISINNVVVKLSYLF